MAGVVSIVESQIWVGKVAAIVSRRKRRGQPLAGIDLSGSKHVPQGLEPAPGIDMDTAPRRQPVIQVPGPA